MTWRVSAEEKIYNKTVETQWTGIKELIDSFVNTPERRLLRSNCATDTRLLLLLLLRVCLCAFYYDLRSSGVKVK